MSPTILKDLLAADYETVLAPCRTKAKGPVLLHRATLWDLELRLSGALAEVVGAAGVLGVAGLDVSGGHGGDHFSKLFDGVQLAGLRAAGLDGTRVGAVQQGGRHGALDHVA